MRLLECPALSPSDIPAWAAGLGGGRDGSLGGCAFRQGLSELLGPCGWGCLRVADAFWAQVIAAVGVLLLLSSLSQGGTGEGLCFKKKKSQQTTSGQLQTTWMPGDKNTTWAVCQALSGRALGAVPGWGTAASPLPSLGSCQAGATCPPSCSLVPKNPKTGACVVQGQCGMACLPPSALSCPPACLGTWVMGWSCLRRALTPRAKAHFWVC